MIISLFAYISHASVACVILTFLWVFITTRLNREVLSLEEIMIKSTAASAVPLGLALVACAFDNELLNHLSGYAIHIAMAGLALLYITYKTIFG